ncbi:MAG: hypothetical protein AAGP08_18300, partial [Pseudomonadota bacterium]
MTAENERRSAAPLPPVKVAAMSILEKVNIAILLVVISYIIALDNVLADVDALAPHLRWFITFFTSIGLFRLLILLVYWLLRSSDMLLS